MRGGLPVEHPLLTTHGAVKKLDIPAPGSPCGRQQPGKFGDISGKQCVRVGCRKGHTAGRPHCRIATARSGVSRCKGSTFAPIEREAGCHVTQAQQPGHVPRGHHQVGKRPNEHQCGTHTLMTPSSNDQLLRRGSSFFAMLPQHTHPAKNVMSPLALHAVKTITYLGCAGAGAIPGRLAANFMSSLLQVSAGTFFVIVCILSGLLVGFFSPLEERLIWGRWFKPSDADLQWIGRSSGTKLTTSIASPFTLGMALGLLSVLIG